MKIIASREMGIIVQQKNAGNENCERAKSTKTLLEKHDRNISLKYNFYVNTLLIITPKTNYPTAAASFNYWGAPFLKVRYQF